MWIENNISYFHSLSNSSIKETVPGGILTFIFVVKNCRNINLFVPK